MKEYRVYEFKVPKEAFEIVEDFLFSANMLGIEVTSETKTAVSFNAYFKSAVGFPDKISKYLRSQFSLKERNWNEEWKKYFKPVQISEKVWVVPSWMKDEFQLPQGSVPIYIYPGQTFGTGTHETTKLTMRFIEAALKPNNSFLDVGCGSGILSILARKIGAGKVVGCDVQKEVVEEVAFNSKLNDVSGIEVVSGSVGNVEGEFDIVVSNIEKHLLEPLIPQIVEKAKETVILSGLLKSQKDEFSKTLRKAGLKIVEERGEGEWITFFCRK